MQYIVAYWLWCWTVNQYRSLVHCSPLLSFPWARNFIPITCCLYCISRALLWKAALCADADFSGKTEQYKKKSAKGTKLVQLWWWCLYCRWYCIGRLLTRVINQYFIIVTPVQKSKSSSDLQFFQFFWRFWNMSYMINWFHIFWSMICSHPISLAFNQVILPKMYFYMLLIPGIKQLIPISLLWLGF